MSDENSSTPYPTVEEQRELVPGDWVRPQDLMHQTRVYRQCDLTKVRICKSYLGIPVPIWKQIGEPMQISPWLDGWDLMIIRGVGLQVRQSFNFVRVPFYVNTDWHTLVIPGRYDYRIEHDERSGLVSLRIKDCNFTRVDRAFREQWAANWKETAACKRKTT